MYNKCIGSCIPLLSPFLPPLPAHPLLSKITYLVRKKITCHFGMLFGFGFALFYLITWTWSRFALEQHLTRTEVQTQAGPLLKDKCHVALIGEAFLGNLAPVCSSRDEQPFLRGCRGEAWGRPSRLPSFRSPLPVKYSLKLERGPKPDWKHWCHSGWKSGRSLELITRAFTLASRVDVFLAHHVLFFKKKIFLRANQMYLRQTKECVVPLYFCPMCWNRKILIAQSWQINTAM